MSECLGQSFAGYYDNGQQEHRGEIEVFVSRKGHVTNWHFDFQENFTVQLSGRKRWRLKRGAVASTIRGATPHFKTGADIVEQQVKAHRASGGPDFAFWPGAGFFDDAQEVELGPGDSFYFPAGVWHEVTATEDCVSINISLASLSWAEVGAAAARHLLTRDDGWRQMVSVDPRVALPLLPQRGAGQGAAASSASESSSSSAAPSAKRARTGVSASSKGGIDGDADTGVATSHCGTTLPPALHAHLSTLLQRMRASLASLRPEFLVPPASLVSLRWGGVPRVPSWLLKEGKDEEGSHDHGGHDGCCDDSGCEDEHSDGDSDEEEGSDGGSASAQRQQLPAYLKASHSVSPRFMVFQRENALHVVVPAATVAAQSAAHATAARLRFRLNPLATLLHKQRDVDRHVTQGSVGGVEWVPALFQAIAEHAPASASTASGKKGGKGAAAQRKPKASATSSGAHEQAGLTGVSPFEAAALVGELDAWVSYVAHVTACGNDDLASQSRVTLHLPARSCTLPLLAALLEATCGGGSGDAALARVPCLQRVSVATGSGASSSSSSSNSNSSDTDSASGLLEFVPLAATGASSKGCSGDHGAHMEAVAEALAFAGVLSRA